MTKSELNQAWYELEEYGPSSDNWPEDIPDFTEPNRFFSEVVPRMISLGYAVRTSSYDAKGKTIHVCNVDMVGKSHPKDTKYFGAQSFYSVGEAGLEAAIKARKELEK